MGDSLNGAWAEFLTSGQVVFVMSEPARPHLDRGARKLTGGNLEVVRAEFST
jgi:hypothetical protein